MRTVRFYILIILIITVFFVPNCYKVLILFIGVIYFALDHKLWVIRMRKKGKVI